MSAPTNRSTPGTPTSRDTAHRPRQEVVLILSTDVLAAALLGGLVETLGYPVRFHDPSEDPEHALKRTHAAVGLVDCKDPSLMREDFLGRARMRNISIVIFGSPESLRGVRKLVADQALDTLVMPATLESLDETLRNAVANC